MEVIYQEINSQHSYQGINGFQPPTVFSTAPAHYSSAPFVVPISRALNDDISSMKTVSKPNVADDGHHQGRWTNKEHDAFLRGLSIYGREWKQISRTIPTRTSAQIRSHAQKYFAKKCKNSEPENNSEQQTFPTRILNGVELCPIIASGGFCMTTDTEGSIQGPIHSSFNRPRFLPFLNTGNCFETPIIPQAQCPNGFVRDHYASVNWGSFVAGRKEVNEFRPVPHLQGSASYLPEQQSGVSFLSSKYGPKQTNSEASVCKIMSELSKCQSDLNEKEMCAIEFLLFSKNRASEESSDLEPSSKKTRIA